jgi:hypothetical protein
MPVPVGFDPANPGDIFDDLPTDQPGVYEKSITPTAIILPYLIATYETPTFIIECNFEDLPYSTNPAESDELVILEIIPNIFGVDYSLSISEESISITSNPIDLNYYENAYVLEILTESIEIGAGTINMDITAAPPIISATYSQSSLYSGNEAATEANMTNAISAETLATGTRTTPSPSWVMMNFGGAVTFNRVVVGSDFDSTLAGGWDKTYVEHAALEISDNGSSWTTLVADIGAFSQAIKTITVSSTTTSYLRVQRTGFLALTEFYCYNQT